VNNPFPLAKKNALGYDRTQVDAVIASAREQFANPSSNLVTAAQLRSTEFELAKGGYSIAAVDSALDRLEDAFFEREAKEILASQGQYALTEQISKLSELLFQRCERPKGNKFARCGLLYRGYSRREVDLFCERVYRVLNSSQQLEVSEVRHVTFKSVRNGYSEHQVDAFINRAVEFIQLAKSR
jgi:DivIVA domain-containing protein